LPWRISCKKDQDFIICSDRDIEEIRMFVNIFGYFLLFRKILVFILLPKGIAFQVYLEIWQYTKKTLCSHLSNKKKIFDKAWLVMELYAFLIVTLLMRHPVLFFTMCVIRIFYFSVGLPSH
jgi:hypothetical protein